MAISNPDPRPASRGDRPPADEVLDLGARVLETDLAGARDPEALIEEIDAVAETDQLLIRTALFAAVARLRAASGSRDEVAAAWRAYERGR